MSGPEMLSGRKEKKISVSYWRKVLKRGLECGERLVGLHGGRETMRERTLDGTLENMGSLVDCCCALHELTFSPRPHPSSDTITKKS